MPKTRRRQRAQSDIRAASMHVQYELAMFRSTFQLFAHLDRDATDRESPGLRQALMESFFIHVRVLDAFFYADISTGPIRDDDMLAEHFIPTWHSVRPPRDPILGVVQQIHKEVAHLTYARVSMPRGGPDRDLRPIRDALRYPIDVFLEEVDPEVFPDFIGAAVGPVVSTSRAGKPTARLSVDGASLLPSANTSTYVSPIITSFPAPPPSDRPDSTRPEPDGQ